MCKVIKEAQPDEVETRYGIKVKEFIEEGRWEVGLEMCRVVHCVTGDLL